MTWEQAIEEINAGWLRLCDSLKNEIEIRDARIDELHKRIGELIEENYKLKMQLIDKK